MRVVAFPTDQECRQYAGQLMHHGYTFVRADPNVGNIFHKPRPAKSFWWWVIMVMIGPLGWILIAINLSDKGDYVATEVSAPASAEAESPWPPPASEPAGPLSPDGQLWWDGQAWRPVR